MFVRAFTAWKSLKGLKLGLEQVSSQIKLKRAINMQKEFFGLWI